MREPLKTFRNNPPSLPNRPLKILSLEDYTTPSICCILNVSAKRTNKNVKEDAMETLLSNGKAAEFLGVSPLTLPRWRWSQTGPAYLKLGRSIKYRQSDLEAFMDKGRVDPEAGRVG